MEKIKMAIVDDHKILRDGLKMMIDELPDTEFLFESSNGVELLNNLKTHHPDIIILDINMPEMSGNEAIVHLKNNYPDIKIIVLSMHGDEPYFNLMNNLGVDAYIVKESDHNELMQAIQTVIHGGKYFSQQLLMNLIDIKHKKTTDNKSFVAFTEREKAVLTWMCKGLSSKEIADKILLSAATIDKIRSELLLKTNSANAVSLIVYAIKNNLVEIETDI